ncbi:MAG: hypothetical protein OEY06_13220 [Gammaproteobacteria bacterium]|nr:hypothetical protein [Gammaproteobacteria bacterium]
MKAHKAIAVLLVFISSISLATLVRADPQELSDQQWMLTYEQWDLVKRGEQLLTMPMLQQVVDIWSIQPDQAIELIYPGGEEGELWVEELKDWLISLAIPSKYLYVVAGSGKADVIIIKISKLEMYSGE